jgi:hypothetical protein
VCGDLLNVFFQESFSSQSLILGYVNEFVCKQPKISRAVSANNYTVPCRQTAKVGNQSHPLTDTWLASPTLSKLRFFSGKPSTIRSIGRILSSCFGVGVDIFDSFNAFFHNPTVLAPFNAAYHKRFRIAV